MLKICQDYYPESLEGFFIANSSLVFRAFYTVVKVFMDSKTKDKFKICGNKYKEELLKLVDKENLPSFLGGECKCKEGCIFSGEGPWKKEEKNLSLSEEEIKIRNDVNSYLLNQNSGENKEREEEKKS